LKKSKLLLALVSLAVILCFVLYQSIKIESFGDVLKKYGIVVCLDQDNELLDLVSVNKTSNIYEIQFFKPEKLEEIKVFALGVNISKELEEAKLCIVSKDKIVVDVSNGVVERILGQGMTDKPKINDIMLKKMYDYYKNKRQNKKTMILIDDQNP